MIKKIIPIFILVGAVVALYAQTFTFSFIQLDEEDHITNRQYFLSSWKSVPQMFTHDTYYPNGTSEFYRPLHSMSFMLDIVRGIHPGWSHIINMAFHAGVTLLLFLFLRELGINRMKALMLALIFAVHPVGSRIVAWVPGRNDATFALFALASCIVFLRWRKHPRLWLYGAHLLLLFGAFLSKELAIVLPIVLLILSSTNKPSRREMMYMLGGWFLVIAAWLMLRTHALAGVSATPWNALFLGIFHNAGAVLFYVQTALVPFRNLVMPTTQYALQWFPIAVSAVFAGGVLVISSRPYVHKKYLWLGFCWFVLFLIPAISGYGTDTRAVLFEHRTYIPLMGLLIMAASVQWGHVAPISRLQRIVIAGIIVVILGVQSFFGARDFKDAETFWKKAVAQAPEYSGAHKGLGSVYINQNNFKDAISEFNRALELNPMEKRVHNNLGVMYLRQRKIQEAEIEFLAELQVNPRYAIAYQNIGFVYATQKRFAEAERAWVTALAIDPWYAAPHQGLAIVYAIAGNKEQSLRHINALIALGVTLPPDVQKLYDNIK